MSTTRQVTLAEVLTSAIDSRLADTYHILPGIVVAYYPNTQEADIQIAVNDPRFDPDSEVLATEPWPIYPKMKVAWPRFGGFTMLGQLAVGDPVQVFFQDLDDSAFRATSQRSDPVRTRRHGSDSAFCTAWSLTDGVAVDGNAAAMVVGQDGGLAQIRFTNTAIQLGRTGADFVALASKVDAINTLLKAFANAIAAGALTVAAGYTAPQSAAVQSTATALAAGVLPTGSTLVKSD